MEGIVFREEAAFSVHPVAEHNLRKPHFNLLAKIGPEAQLVDDFRVALTGPKCVTVEFHGSDFFPHAAMADFTFEYQVDPDDLQFDNNRMSTQWVDLADLVSSGEVAAVTEGQHDFATKWGSHCGATNPPAACLRWLIAEEDDDSLALHLQGLPATADMATSKPGLRRDDAPARYLGKDLEISSCSKSFALGKFECKVGCFL